MPETWLPLFPLRAVLFPQSLLPLHIFEERYKILVRECLAGTGSFGINLMRSEGIASVGCSAVVKNVVREYEDGRLDIVVEGGERYDLLRTVDDRAPYLVGEIRYIGRGDDVAERSLALETIDLFNTVMAHVLKDGTAPVVPNRVAKGLSFVLAQKAGLDLEQRQALLELRGENDRIKVIRKYLEELIPRLDHIEEIERIVKNDGYL
jgi:Lon protease-like protein